MWCLRCAQVRLLPASPSLMCRYGSVCKSACIILHQSFLLRNNNHGTGHGCRTGLPAFASCLPVLSYLSSRRLLHRPVCNPDVCYHIQALPIRPGEDIIFPASEFMKLFHLFCSDCKRCQVVVLIWILRIKKSLIPAERMS